MYIDKEDHLLLKEFDDAGVEVIYADKHFGDAKAKTKEEILDHFGLSNKKVISGYQTHTKNIQIIKDVDNLYYNNTDGYITDRKDVVLFTKYGDCLPIFFYDTNKKAIGVVHSGWKGTYQEIGIEAVKLMNEYYKSNYEDIHIAFGIGISAKNYEVGHEFFNDFKAKFSSDIVERSFYSRDNKIYFDNQEFNYLNFVSKGIPEINIIKNDHCTYDEKRFFSYRREKDNPGRNGALIYFK